MQSRSIIAEQTSRNRYWFSASLAPREIELTVRLEIPEKEGVDVGISPSFTPPLPPAWVDSLMQRLYVGVHSGIASVGMPLPTGGIGVEVTQVRVLPPLGANISIDDAGELSNALEALTASSVAALWTGINSLRAPSS